jgi:Ca2+-transporting ATPase
MVNYIHLQKSKGYSYMLCSETMGNATAVCSDKTGTLTENKMTVVSGSIAEKNFSKSYDMQRWRYQMNPLALDLAMESISVNSTAFEGKDQDGNIKFIGSTTECAMIEFAKKLGYSYQDQRSASKSANIYPFSSAVKSMTTIVEINDSNTHSPDRSDYRVYTKGAAENVIRYCTHYIDVKGQVKPLDRCTRMEQEILVNSYAERSLRTLALAYRDVDAATYQGFHPDDAPLHDLVLLGVIGIQDQLRPGVIESVQAFRRAGVFIRMVKFDKNAFLKLCTVLKNQMPIYFFRSRVTIWKQLKPLLKNAAF